VQRWSKNSVAQRSRAGSYRSTVFVHHQRSTETRETHTRIAVAPVAKRYTRNDRHLDQQTMHRMQSNAFRSGQLSGRSRTASLNETKSAVPGIITNPQHTS